MTMSLHMKKQFLGLFLILNLVALNFTFAQPGSTQQPILVATIGKFVNKKLKTEGELPIYVVANDKGVITALRISKTNYHVKLRII